MVNPHEMNLQEFWDTFGDPSMPAGFEWRDCKESPGEIHLYGSDGTDYSVPPVGRKGQYVSPRHITE